MRRVNRASLVMWAAVVAAAFAMSGASAQAARSAASMSHRAVPARASGIGLSSPADTGASDIANLGSGGWKVASSAVATQAGAQISAPGFDTSSWLPVSNDDAGAQIGRAHV